LEYKKIDEYATLHSHGLWSTLLTLNLNLTSTEDIYKSLSGYRIADVVMWVIMVCMGVYLTELMI